MALTISSVVLTVDFHFDETNTTLDGRTFRAEILNVKGRQEFYTRIYRLEMVRLQPTFPQTEGKPRDVADCDMWILDDFFDGMNIHGTSCDETLDKIEKTLVNRLLKSSG